MVGCHTRRFRRGQRLPDPRDQKGPERRARRRRVASRRSERCLNAARTFGSRWSCHGSTLGKVPERDTTFPAHASGSLLVPPTPAAARWPATSRGSARHWSRLRPSTTNTSPGDPRDHVAPQVSGVLKRRGADPGSRPSPRRPSSAPDGVGCGSGGYGTSKRLLWRRPPNAEKGKEAAALSDADDQMGGTGGETGAPPGTEPPATKDRPGDEHNDQPDDQPDDPVNEDSEESFPASDPPAHY
jgi:hypothetical protein